MLHILVLLVSFPRANFVRQDWDCSYASCSKMLPKQRLQRFRFDAVLGELDSDLRDPPTWLKEAEGEEKIWCEGKTSASFQTLSICYHLVSQTIFRSSSSLEDFYLDLVPNIMHEYTSKMRVLPLGDHKDFCAEDWWDLLLAISLCRACVLFELIFDIQSQLGISPALSDSTPSIWPKILDIWAPKSVLHWYCWSSIKEQGMILQWHYWLESLVLCYKWGILDCSKMHVGSGQNCGSWAILVMVLPEHQVIVHWFRMCSALQFWIGQYHYKNGSRATILSRTNMHLRTV